MVGCAEGVKFLHEAAKSLCLEQNCILSFTRYTLAIRTCMFYIVGRSGGHFGARGYDVG